MIRVLEKLWERSNRVPVLAASGLSIALIALVDWWTLPYVSLGFLYLFPIMLAAGFLPRPALMALGVLCAAMTERFSSLYGEGRPVRLMFEILALTGCGLFVAELRRYQVRSSEAEMRLRVLVETSPAAIIIVEECGSIELANRAALQMFLPIGAPLVGQSIGAFAPDFENVLRSCGDKQLRSSIQCPARRGNGESFVAEAWFSTFQEGRAKKLAAIVAEVPDDRNEPPEAESSPPGMNGRADLNARQMAVLRLVLQGLTSSDIAGRLGLTPSLVKTTLRQLFSKVGVRNRSQMVRFALEHYRDIL